MAIINSVFLFLVAAFSRLGLFTGVSAQCTDAACAVPATLFSGQDPTLGHLCSGVVGYYTASSGTGTSLKHYIQIDTTISRVAEEASVTIFNSTSVCQRNGVFCGLRDTGARNCQRLARQQANVVAFTCNGGEREIHVDDGVVLAVFKRELVSLLCVEGVHPAHVAVLLSGTLTLDINNCSSANGVEEEEDNSVSPVLDSDRNQTGGCGRRNNSETEVSGDEERNSTSDPPGGEEGVSSTGREGSGEGTDSFLLSCKERRGLPHSCNGEEQVEYIIQRLENGELDTTLVKQATALIIHSNQTVSLPNRINLFNSLVKSLQDQPEEASIVIDHNTTQELVSVLEQIISNNSEWSQVENRTEKASELLASAETLLALLAKQVQLGELQTVHLLNPSIGVIVVSGKSLAEDVNGITTINIHGADNGKGATVVRIPVSLLCKDSTRANCSGVAAVGLLGNLSHHLTNSADNSIFSADYLLSLQVVGAPQLTELIGRMPINIEFGTTNKLDHTKERFRCVYWNVNHRAWAVDGVTTAHSSSGHPLCSASHLTGFSVLLDTVGLEIPRGEQFALKVVSYVGCTVSVICLFMTLTAFILFRKTLNKGSLFYVHLNLVIALILAYSTFAAGIESAVPIEWLCTLVAVLLHYLFLCVFCWMLAEGIMLYLLVVRVFGTAAEKWYYLLILGWGIPILIVVPSIAVRYQDYGNEHFCWVTVADQHGTIWAFAAPSLAILMTNTVFLVMALAGIIRSRRYSVNTTTLRQATLGMKSAVVLLPLLGLTWAFGLLAVNRNTTVFAWLFTIFNSLQGCFIFLLHVLRNDKVLQSVKQCFCPRHRHSNSKVSDAATFTVSAIPKAKFPDDNPAILPQ